MLAGELNPRLGVIQVYAVIEMDADERPPRVGLGQTEQVAEKQRRAPLIPGGNRQMIKKNRHQTPSDLAPPRAQRAAARTRCGGKVQQKARRPGASALTRACLRRVRYSRIEFLACPTRRPSSDKANTCRARDTRATANASLDREDITFSRIANSETGHCVRPSVRWLRRRRHRPTAPSTAAQPCADGWFTDVLIG
jgi:hypothetical protein